MISDIKLGREQILVVDDMLPNRKILERIISGMNHNPVLASSGEEAIQKLKEGISPGIILLDISMPDMDGFDLCRILKADVKTRDIPVIFISAFSGIDDVVKGFELGGVDYICKPFVPAEVSVRITNHLRMWKMQKEREEYNQRLNRLIDEQSEQIENEKRKVLYGLVAINSRLSNIPISHIDNAKHNCRILAQSLQLSTGYEQLISNTFIENIEVAAPLYNIGMIAISKDIVPRIKAGTMTEKDMDEYRMHPDIGADMIAEIEPDCENNEFCGMVMDLSRYHHERWDGTGFPKGLKGEEIPLSARIISLVMTFQELTDGTNAELSVEDAIEHMKSDRNKIYDPGIFDIFVKIKNQLRIG